MAVLETVLTEGCMLLALQDMRVSSHPSDTIYKDEIFMLLSFQRTGTSMIRFSAIHSRLGLASIDFVDASWVLKYVKPIVAE
jgi:hypothetical protein